MSITENGAAVGSGVITESGQAVAGPITETGEAVLVIGISAQTITDSGSGADVILINKSLPLTDSSAAADLVKTNKGILITESGPGTENILTDKTVLILDPGAAAENILTNKDILISELGSSAELILTNKELIISELNYVLENILINKSLLVQDTGSGLDLITAAKLITVIDSSTGLDLIDVITTFLVEISDSGTAAEVIDVIKLIPYPEFVDRGTKKYRIETDWSKLLIKLPKNQDQTKRRSKAWTYGDIAFRNRVQYLLDRLGVPLEQYLAYFSYAQALNKSQGKYVWLVDRIREHQILRDRWETRGLDPGVLDELDKVLIYNKNNP